MIELTNLNKYFNKGKQNQIHVINDTSLQLPKSGLITLLGDSGSGKTTLLNVIGGLDKTDGTIRFKEKIISNYNAKVWDKLRVNNIGFIFQNYHLLEDKTINENIKMVLSLMGITNKEEIEYRTKYVLEAVGMYRFRNKLASDLSGGQKQRVAIARAIVKNPDVIIADEPTGNLDSNNSIEILKIIKEISKDKLVVLVTHNQDLAHYYADRIIEISDGKVIKDQLNFHKKNELKYIDNNVYLKDLNNLNNENINIYSNEDLTKVKITLVKINNNYYLESDEKNITIKILNNESNIKLIDDHKKNVEQTFTNKTSFNLPSLEKNNKERVKPNVYTIKDSFIQAFRKLNSLGKKGKAQIFALIFLAMMFTSSFLSFTSVLVFDTSSVDYDKNHYFLEYGRDFLSHTEYGEDTLIFISNDVYLYNGSFQSETQLKIYPKEAIGKENTDKTHLYIDEAVLDKGYDFKYLYEAFGINKKEHFINQKVRIYGIEEELYIVDTVKTNTHAIYVSSDLLLNMVNNNLFSLKITDFLEEELLLNETLLPTLVENVPSFYVSEKYYGEEYKLFNSLNYIESYNIAGYYVDESEHKDRTLYLNKIDFKNIALENREIDLQIYTRNSENIASVAKNKYEEEVNFLKEIRDITLVSGITQSMITLIISVVVFYFLVRSSLTERKKEISILRSLGISKKEVSKLFIIEYFILITFTSLIGVVIGGIYIKMVSNSFLGGIFNLRVDSFTFILTVLLVYVVNIGSSFLPLWKMLKKTPADLLTNYDI